MLVMLGLAGALQAQSTPAFYFIDDPDPSNLELTQPIYISTNGRMLVGDTRPTVTSSDSTPVRWSREQGRVFLTEPLGYPRVYPYAISDDGSRTAGAIRLTSDSVTTAYSAPLVGPYVPSFVSDQYNYQVSCADGTATFLAGVRIRLGESWRAFCWSEETGIVVMQGDPFGFENEISVNSMSADGQIMVGYCSDVIWGFNGAVWWSRDGTAHNLPGFNGSPNSSAVATYVSSNGRFVAGEYSLVGGGWLAVVWERHASGSFVVRQLPVPAGWHGSSARGISDAGDVAFGRAYTPANSGGFFVWTSTDGAAPATEFFRARVPSMPADWEVSYVAVMSADGRTFAGGVKTIAPPYLYKGFVIDLGTPCVADFNADGGVDGSDIEAFFLPWQDGLPIADVNGDGGIDGADIETFFVVWEAGGC